MLRIASGLQCRPCFGLMAPSTGYARTIANYTIDEEFRQRMLLPEPKSKRGRFYFVDQPLVRHTAELWKPYVKGKHVIHGTPGPGVLTLALVGIGQTASMRVVDHNGFFIPSFELLQDSTYPELKIFTGSILRTTPNVQGEVEEDDDLDTILPIFGTFSEIMQDIPKVPWTEEPAHTIVSPFGPELLHFLGTLLPHVSKQTGWFEQGRCTILGAVSCLPNDPILLGSAPKSAKLPYYHAAINQVFDIDVLDEIPAKYATAKMAPGVHTTKGNIRILAFKPKLEGVPSLEELALFRIIYPQAANLDTTIKTHISSHGITEDFVDSILRMAGLTDTSTVRDLTPSSSWRLFKGYQEYCEPEFLTQLFINLATVKMSDSVEAWRAQELEEERRHAKDYGVGLDSSFWHIGSRRFQRLIKNKIMDDSDLATDALFDPYRSTNLPWT